jgi:hypothetical protein
MSETYAPAYNVFNGSTLSFDGSDIGALVDMEFSVGGQKVDVGSASDEAMLWGQGLDDVEVTCTVKGTASLTRGDTGALSASWNTEDGGEDLPDLDNAMLNAVSTSGSKDTPITTKITFVQAPESSS